MISRFPGGLHRELMDDDDVFTKGLTCDGRDSSSLFWINRRPQGWNAVDWVRVIRRVRFVLK